MVSQDWLLPVPRRVEEDSSHSTDGDDVDVCIRRLDDTR